MATPLFAEVLSDDGIYEAFNGNNITVDNVLEEDKIDIEIEGNALVNLVDNGIVKHAHN